MVLNDKHFLSCLKDKTEFQFQLIFFAQNYFDTPFNALKRWNVSQFQRNKFYILIERSVPGGMRQIRNNFYEMTT